MTVTQALGVVDAGQVVGQYVDAGGTAHGFTYQDGVYRSVDYNGPTPDGKPATATTVNGVNNKGQIVGFYAAANGDTIGFVGRPVAPGGTPASP